MITCGVPLFLLEVSIGQYLGVGGMNVIGQICPIFKGVGYSAIMMFFFADSELSDQYSSHRGQKVHGTRALG